MTAVPIGPGPQRRATLRKRVAGPGLKRVAGDLLQGEQSAAAQHRSLLATTGNAMVLRPTHEDPAADDRDAIPATKETAR